MSVHVGAGAKARKLSLGPIVLTLCGLFVLVTAAVATAIWQTGGRHDRSTAVSPVAASAAGADHAGLVQPVDMAPVSRAAPPAPAPALTVYVVGSQELAEIMRNGLALANLVRVSKPPLRYTVIVVGTETADAVLQALQDDARILADGGAPVQVIDLRASPAGQ